MLFFVAGGQRLPPLLSTNLMMGHVMRHVIVPLNFKLHAGRCTSCCASMKQMFQVQQSIQLSKERALSLCVTCSHRWLLLTCAQLKLNIPTDAVAVEFFVSYLTGPMVLLDFYHFCDSNNSFDGLDIEHDARSFVFRKWSSAFSGSSSA